MRKIKKSYKELFTGTKTFYGNLRGKEDSDYERVYRFKVVVNEAGNLIAIPEVYSEELDEWRGACPGWRLEDVTGTKGLFLDFGQKRFIIPTEKVWDEITDALNNYDHKRT